MSRLAKIIIILFILSFTLLPTAASAQNAEVKAVIFYSPTCGHCYKVITENFPLLWQKYGGDNIEMYYSPPPTPAVEGQGPAFVAFFGDQLSILHVDVSTPEGSELFSSALNTYNLGPEYGVVPTLLVGNFHLVGSAQIPDEFPGIIEQGLAQGGIDWPPVPGLDQILDELVPVPIEETGIEATPEGEDEAQSPNVINDERPSISDLFQQDTLGNSISVVVLLGMLVSTIYVGSRFTQQSSGQDTSHVSWIVFLLAGIGIAVAGYLSYVETTGTEAVCGPVGDCNTVQNSEYAVLFGVLPIGVFGLIGYIAIIGAWIWTHIADEHLADYATLALFAMAAFGSLFSIYLTFLEPFVIGATCAWCLASAVLITAIMVLSTEPAMHALAQVRSSGS